MEQSKVQQLQMELLELQWCSQEREKSWQAELALLQSAKESLSKEFENIANRLFDQKQDHFVRSAKSQLESLILPFRETHRMYFWHKIETKKNVKRSHSMTEYLLYMGGAIVAALLTVALYLHWRLFQLNRQIKQRQLEAEKKYAAARQHLNQSIQIICKALIDDQVGYAEASLRISKLMDQLSVPADLREEFIAFDKLSDAIIHIPILDAWHNLPKQQKHHYSRQIDQQEELLGDFVKDAARRLIGHAF
jgi:hypothetical protein